VCVYFAYQYVDSPKEKILKRELNKVKGQYELLNKRMSKVDAALKSIADRDDNTYRVIFEANPISPNQRAGSFGGTNLYADLDGFDNTELMVNTAKNLDKLSRKLYVQSKSFDEIEKLVKNKTAMMQSIPAIQPISNKTLMRIASGFGYRTHPIYKIVKFHTGIDFAASPGTPIYATGDGVVEGAISDNSGYGLHVVIDHGYGYKTLYGHMSRMKSTTGQKVKRGDIIGYVGSTGASTGPHCHYEVIKNGTKIDPINFFFSDLNPSDYEQILQRASQTNQSFD
jgi:murein DD-endopeptidase MepM/ murein hydrolase activator NlpD